MSRKEEPFLLKYLKHEGKEIRKFLTSRDLLIFVFFLIVSTGLWALQAMRKEYETIIQIPITYEKAPEGLVQQAELPQRLLITVTDDGTSLVRYRWMHSYNPIAIDISAYTDGTYSLPTAEFESHQVFVSYHDYLVVPRIIRRVRTTRFSTFSIGLRPSTFSIRISAASSPTRCPRCSTVVSIGSQAMAL